MSVLHVVAVTWATFVTALLSLLVVVFSFGAMAYSDPKYDLSISASRDPRVVVRLCRGGRAHPAVGGAAKGGRGGTAGGGGDPEAAVGQGGGALGGGHLLLVVAVVLMVWKP